VPFYLLPYVGGGDTVRSFREFRFRDENAGVFGAELRHKVHPMAHVAAFVDFGKVARDWQDINPHHVKNAYGIGLRGGSDDKTYVRFDVAHGDGGTRVFLKFTPSF
jgi:hemolysin activation/secretion protein